MQVILADDVVGLGDIGETVEVKPGYARNYLIPKCLAIEISSGNAKSVLHKLKTLEAKKRRMHINAENVAKSIRSISVDLSLRVGEFGKVFGSLNAKHIAAKLDEQGVVIDRRRIMLEEPINKPGIHYVKVKLHSDVFVQLKINVKKTSASKDLEDSEEVIESL